jgi:hypothetical protein
MAVVYGERVLQKDMNGPDVVELQVRLAGFRGTLFDGGFGSGTELQVQKFQQDFMKMANPTRVVDRATFAAIDDFAKQNPVNFADLKCPCGQCGGFGQGRFKGRYMPGGEGQEAFHRYEYPGIHRAILWAARAISCYVPQFKLAFSSGYRCSIDNQNHKRTTTNHHGKAIDIKVPRVAGRSEREHLANCNNLRGLLVEHSSAQIGWAAKNRKALEPGDIAPTWVHYDVRQYESQFLREEFFCTDLAGLNKVLPIKV